MFTSDPPSMLVVVIRLHLFIVGHIFQSGLLQVVLLLVPCWLYIGFVLVRRGSEWEMRNQNLSPTTLVAYSIETVSFDFFPAPGIAVDILIELTRNQAES
jgi:hypothetical protein